MEKLGLKASMLLGTIVLLLLLAACSSSDGNDVEKQTNNNTSVKENQENDTNGNNEPKEPAEPLGKYETPIQLTTVQGVTDGIEFKQGESMENNVWIRSYAEELGIELSHDWVVNQEQYDQKLNVSIVSGDLPDFFEVDARQFQTLVEGDMLYDLTDVYDEYISDFARNAMEANNGIALEVSTYQDRLMAIPNMRAGGGTTSATMLWIRTDWLENLGLSEPKTMDDLIDIITAFVKDDPDGDQKDDTFGLNMNKEIYNGFSGLEGFFNGFHAYPYNQENTMWIKGKDGKLAYAGIQPEMKDALKVLQELFEMGAIDPEFAVYDAGKSAENVLNNKTGVFFGRFSNPAWPLRNFKEQNPQGELKPFMLVSADGQPAKSIVPNPAPNKFYVVSKDAEHPEAVIKLLNFFYEKVYSENAELDKFQNVVEGDKTYYVHNYAPIKGGIVDENQNAHRAVVKALESGDTSKLSDKELGYYQSIMKYRDGDPTQYFRERIFGPESAFAVLSEYEQNDLFALNQYTGPPTPVMAEKGSTLKDLELQTITQIIMGEPLDQFDQFVEQWKQLGGDTMTKEVNDWYELKGK